MVTFLPSLVVMRLHHRILDDGGIFYEILPFCCDSKSGCNRQNTDFVLFYETYEVLKNVYFSQTFNRGRNALCVKL